MDVSIPAVFRAITSLRFHSPALLHHSIMKSAIASLAACLGMEGGSVETQLHKCATALFGLSENVVRTDTLLGSALHHLQLAFVSFTEDPQDVAVGHPEDVAVGHAQDAADARSAADPRGYAQDAADPDTSGETIRSTPDDHGKDPTYEQPSDEDDEDEDE